MKKIKKPVVTELQPEFKPLFEAFKLTQRYQEKGCETRFSLRKNAVYDILTQEDLDAIEEVNIKFGNNARKLIMQIDKLVPNLKSLTIETMSDILVSKKIERIMNTAIEKRPTDQKKQDFIDTFYGYNKLSDAEMAHVFNLTKLEELRIPSQTRITKLDFSKMPNLKVVLAKNCINLKEITGFNDNLFFTNYSTFDFTGCDKLDNKTIESFAEKFDPKRFENKIVTPGHLFLPLNSMLRKNISNVQNFVDFGKNYPRDAVMFSQSSNGVLINHFASDSQQYGEKLDEIIGKVCKPESNNLKNIYYLYHWVTNHIEYDDTTAWLEKQNFELINENKEVAREASENISERTRSAIYALQKKHGVCVAISELFGDLVYRAGLAKEVRQVCCSTERTAGYLQTRSNHQITALKFEGVGEYYFDPTCDIQKIAPRFFAKNKHEISQKFTLSYRESAVDNSPSLYQKNAIDLSESKL